MRVMIGPSSFAEKDDLPLRMLQAAGLEVVDNPFKRRLTEREIVEHLRGADGLIAGLEPLNAEVLASAAGTLKAVARVGIGVSNVDFDAAAQHGIKVSSTPDAPATAVAEMTLAALLTVSREIIPLNAAMHGERWEKSIGMSLTGRKALVIGYGRIGAKVAALLHAFGCRVVVSDPVAQADAMPEGIALAPLEAALPHAEIITLHASGDAVILGDDQFAKMNKGVVLLNSARGELVSQSALIHALESGVVSGGWFDAFWEEPYHGPLTKYEQMLLTPHVGTYTLQCRRDMETQAVRNLLADLGLPDPTAQQA